MRGSPCQWRLPILLGLLVAATAAPLDAEPEEKPAAPKQPAGSTREAFKEETTAMEVPVPSDLGPPLAENADKLTRLDPRYPVWVDKQGKQVVMVGSVCKRFGPLELFACLTDTKEYESIVSVHTTASLVQAALLAVGAKPGSPVKYEPAFAPPHGTTIEITVVWKADDQLRTMRAQEWVRQIGTDKHMEQAWVFAGGAFWRAEDSDKEIFIPNTTGNLICVANFEDAVLDVPTRSTTTDVALLFEAFAERIPERGTPVTLILKPQLEAKE
jgi:hypothetical protein